MEDFRMLYMYTAVVYVSDKYAHAGVWLSKVKGCVGALPLDNHTLADINHSLADICQVAHGYLRVL